MRTSMPASVSIWATASTFSRRGLLKIWRMVPDRSWGAWPRSARAQVWIFYAVGLKATWGARSGLSGHVFGDFGVADHADQAFLRRAGYQAALAVEDLAARQSAGILRAGAVDRVQQPLVGAERTMEPQRVVKRGHLHVRLVVADAVRKRRRAEQVEVRGVGEQGTMQFRRIADTLAQAEPDLLVRRALGRVELVARIHVAELERTPARQPALDLDRQRRHHVLGHRRRGLDVLRLGDLGHRQLVLAAALVLLERGGHEKNHLAMLDGADAAYR